MMTSHPAGWTATELAQAAASRQLELYYQPLVDLRNRGRLREGAESYAKALASDILR